MAITFKACRFVYATKTSRGVQTIVLHVFRGFNPTVGIAQRKEIWIIIQCYNNLKTTKNR